MQVVDKARLAGAQRPAPARRIVQDRLFESDFDRAIKQIETEREPGNEDK